MTPYLIVDTQRVLRECEPAKYATASLETMMKRSEARRDEMLRAAQKAAGPQKRAHQKKLLAFERERRGLLMKRRAALRAALLEAVKDVAREIARERGIDLVLDAGTTLVFAPDADVTDDLIERLNRAGAVKKGGSPLSK